MDIKEAILVCKSLVQSNVFARISPAESKAIMLLVNHVKETLKKEQNEPDHQTDA